MNNINFIEVDSGETLCYRKIPSQSNINAKNIVFVHPNFLSQISWDPILKYFSDYNIYTFDMRGFGQSTYKKQLTQISDFSNDLISLCSKLNLTKIQLIGWSLGGAVCMNTALIKPQLVESIILMGSVNIKGFPFLTKNKERERNINNIKQKLIKFNELIQSKNHKFYFDYLVNEKLLPRKNVVGNEYQEIIFKQIEQQRNYIDATSVLGIWDISDQCHLIQCPILLYHGTNDIVIPFDNAISNYQEFKKYNNNTFLCSLEGGSHSPIYEVPEDMAKLFIQFIINHNVQQQIIPKL